MASLPLQSKIIRLTKAQAPPTSTRPAKRPLKSALKPQKGPLSRNYPASSPFSAFATSKKDKRHIKHSNLISKVTKSSSISTEAQRNKRRRQKKQLVTNLGALADALPDADGNEAGARGAGAGRGAALREQANVNVIHRKSIKSRPGALKRRQKIDNGERERFARNLAEMSGKKTSEVGEPTGKEESGQQGHDRWTALRGFISQTMERRPEMSESKS
jgi:Ribosome biogenesis protein SLX9